MARVYETLRTSRVGVRFDPPEEVAIQYYELKETFEESGIEGSFIQFLILSFWDSWGGVLGESDKWERIYRRDRYECISPVCSSRDVTLHHVQFQGHGGGDEDGNVIALCARCHLWGVHEGRLAVSGFADALGSWLTWHLGRECQMSFQGRRRA